MVSSVKAKNRFIFRTLLPVFLIYAWLTNLRETDSYYSVYVLCALAGILAVMDNAVRGTRVSGRNRVWTAVSAALFSLSVVLANDPLFEPITALLSLANAGLTLLGGFVLCWNVLSCLAEKLPVYRSAENCPTHPGRVFLWVFLAVVLVDSVFLFFAQYPGVISVDSVSTIRQVMEHDYDNVMPFWHTVSFGALFRLGYLLFHDYTAAVAFFHFMQILFMAACFGFAVMTLYEARVPKGWILAAALLYVFSYYNIIYSVTLWKDVPFGGAVLLFVAALYRLIRHVGKHRWVNYAVMIAGAMGLSLLRTNGWYAFLVTALIMLLALRGRERKLITAMLTVLVLCWVLLNPVLSLLDANEMSYVEALAVPFQQVARVIANGRSLTQEEEALLSRAFSLEKVKEVYTPETVDPVKFEAFRYGNLPELKEHLPDYLRLYVRLGLRYPGDYFRAWVEETKGYWNGGYEFWVYNDYVLDNEYGIAAGSNQNIVSSGFHALFRYQEKLAILQPLFSVGLCNWIIIACCVLNIVKRREEFALSVPVIVLAAGLWVGTPACTTFRCAYRMILTMPVILLVTIFDAGTADHQQ